MSTLTNQTVLVTGAAGALGGVVAAKFLKEGYQVLATDLHSLKNSMKNEKNLQWLKMDVSDSQSVIAQSSLLQTVDVLIHCAGGFRFGAVVGTRDEDLDFLINVNLKSAFFLTREILPSMMKRNFGRLFFVSSRSTLHAPAGMAAYAASKAGLNMLVSSLSEEIKKYNINVNAVLPTVLDTPANRKDMPQADFSTWVKTEELAEILFSLTQSYGKPINGALISVAGRL